MAASLSGPIDRSTLLFFTVTGLASTFKIASAAITTSLLAAVLVEAKILGLGIVASIIEIFAVLSLLTSVVLFLRRLSTRTVLLAWIPGAVSSLLGAILSLVTMVCLIHDANEGHINSANTRLARGSAAAGIAIAIVGLIPQTAYYIWIWPRSENDEDRSTTVEVTERRPSPPRSVKRNSIALHLGTIGPTSPPKFFRPHPEPNSPSRSIFSSNQRSSLKESAGQLLRPVTSKTRLMGSPFSSTRDVRSFSNESRTEAMRSSNDDFGDWDTSGIEDRYDSPFASKTRVTKLETIPGSRPVSPAKALHGPFPTDDSDEAPSEELPPPDANLDPPMSPTSETGSLRSLRPNIRVNTNKESHIHPLFRTESPVPPPMASPGTVITASPYAGQVVSPEMRPMSPWLNGSRPGSPNAAAFTSRSRTGSVKSTRTVPSSPATSPIEPPQRSFSSLSKARRVHPND